MPPSAARSAARNEATGTAAGLFTGAPPGVFCRARVPWSSGASGGTGSHRVAAHPPAHLVLAAEGGSTWGFLGCVPFGRLAGSSGRGELCRHEAGGLLRSGGATLMSRNRLTAPPTRQGPARFQACAGCGRSRTASTHRWHRRTTRSLRAASFGMGPPGVSSTRPRCFRWPFPELSANISLTLRPVSGPLGRLVSQPCHCHGQMPEASGHHLLGAG